jgi:hypothetical protein
MGLSKNPYLRRIQAKNRVQFLKGAITVVFGLTCVAFFIESLPQSKYQRSCNSEDSLRVKRQVEGEDAPVLVEPTTCGGEFRASHELGADSTVECRNILNSAYGPDWQKAEIDYDCISWCDTTDYPTSVFTIRERKYGAVGLYILGLLYMFLALAIVCDEYFVPALEQVSDKLNLSDDVAGATFMPPEDQPLSYSLRLLVRSLIQTSVSVLLSDQPYSTFSSCWVLALSSLDSCRIKMVIQLF